MLLSKARIGAAAFVLFVAWIIYLANTGRNDLFPMNLVVLPHTDKLGHLALYGILALLLGAAWNHRRIALGRWTWDAGAFVATLFASLEEASQHLSPHRTPDLLDLLCGFAGIWLARKLFGQRPHVTYEST